MDDGNPGSKRGTITHLVLECIQNPKRHHLIESFQENGFAGNKNIHRLVLKHAKVLEIDDEENLSLIENFIKVGLKTDFLCEGWDLKDPEKKFELVSENPEVRALGYIDKHAISKDGAECRIDDYKTSKVKFTGKDIKFNVQALMYALAMFREGAYKKLKVNFIFLKFPKSPVQSFEFEEATLKGFEHYLSDIYKYLKSFNSKKACSNFAKNNDSYFLCGKEPGDLKKDGSPAWVCPVKRGFLYWEVKDADNKIKFTSKTEQLALDKMIEGDTIQQKLYKGCPAWIGK